MKLLGRNLSGADLRGANLSRANLLGTNLAVANLSGANLFRADLNGVNLNGVNLSEAKLRGTNLNGADLSEADLRGAKLNGAKLIGANLNGADLSEADLRGANLESSLLIKTNLNKANLTGCRVFGLSAWNLKLEETTQAELIITPEEEPAITVDNLEVAQFIYLLLNNEKIRRVIDTITTKVVLILGRFSEERKAVLDAIRDELRKQDYLPILFDFENPANRDLTETVSTLAHMARFIIADISEPRCIPHELATIIPTLSVPVQPLLLEGATGEYAMFRDLRKYSWVLPICEYKDSEELIKALPKRVLLPAEKKAKELKNRR